MLQIKNQLLKAILPRSFLLEQHLRRIHLGVALRLQKLNSRLGNQIHKTTSEDSRVLISMSTYNGARWVEDAVISVFKQNYNNWHLHITDDGSTDDTPKILSRLATSNPDRITLNLLQKNCYPESPINFAIKHFLQSTEYSVLTVLDQDDVAEPYWLKVGVGLLSQTVQCVRCNNSRWNEDFSTHLYDYPAASQIFIPINVARRVGLRINRDVMLATDTEYLTRITKDALKHKYAIVVTVDICQKMRIHGRNMTVTKLAGPEIPDATHNGRQSERH